MNLGLLSFIALLVFTLLTAFFIFKILKIKKKSKNDESSSLSMRRAFNLVDNAIILLSKNGTILYANTSAMKLLNCELRSMLSKNFWSLFSLKDIVSNQRLINGVESLLAYSKGRILLSTLGGREITVGCKISQSPYVELGADSYLLLLNDISDLQILESRLRILETYDPLTRLPNRRAIESHIKRAINDVKKHRSTHIYCCLSIDRYEYIVDLFGHAAGDELVKQISQLLRNHIDTTHNILSYLNNSEFGILLKDIEPKPALDKMNQISAHIKHFNFSWMGEVHKVTASIGYYVIYRGNFTTVQVLYDANLASKVAKETGGDEVYIFRENDKKISARKGNVVWSRRLKTAFEDNLFQLFAQAIHPLPEEEYNKTFSHYEVLIRMQNHDGNWISPADFLPAAEQHNMMLLIDKWVVAEVAKHLKLINDRSPLPVFSVNLSGHSLGNTQFLYYVLNVLKKTQVNPKMICFEITETIAVNDLSLATRFINALRGKGCSFSLDDFGTGVSSYGYLRQLDVNYLKIDGSFVKIMGDDSVSYEMVRSINQVGHAMGLKVIAEYVEDDRIVRLLREVGVDFGQGYGIHKPEPISNVIKRHIIRATEGEDRGKVSRDGKGDSLYKKLAPKPVNSKLTEVVKLKI